ncbi:hypothetical protein ACC685_36485, partial [Rhizobium ruizarguesonis]
LSLCAIVFLSPYVFMISTSGKAQSDIFTSSLSLIPAHLTYSENFGKALSLVPMARLLWNGVVVCGLIFFFGGGVKLARDRRQPGQEQHHVESG